MTAKKKQAALNALSLRLDGMSIKEIANTLGKSKRTVDYYFDELRAEYNASDLVHLIGILYSIKGPLRVKEVIEEPVKEMV